MTLYARCKAEGVCTRCRKAPALEGHVHCQPCKDKLREYNDKIKLACFDAYGGPWCKCCGEAEFQFLSLDHVADNGARHRTDNKITSGLSTYLWAKRNNYPPIFEILCFNCNTGRQISPDHICPHQRKPKEDDQ